MITANKLGLELQIFPSAHALMNVQYILFQYLA